MQENPASSPANDEGLCLQEDPSGRGGMGLAIAIGRIDSETDGLMDSEDLLSTLEALYLLICMFRLCLTPL